MKTLIDKNIEKDALCIGEEFEQLRDHDVDLEWSGSITWEACLIEKNGKYVSAIFIYKVDLEISWCADFSGIDSRGWEYAKDYTIEGKIDNDYFKDWKIVNEIKWDNGLAVTGVLLDFQKKTIEIC